MMSMKNSPITTHVLDLTRGRPAAGMAVQLERREPTSLWQRIGSGKTDPNGRLSDLTDAPLQSTCYRLIFATGDYFAAQGTESFYPTVTIEFQIETVTEHYHVPLLLSQFGYSTYRGS